MLDDDIVDIIGKHDLIEFAENWMLSPDEKVDEEMIHFYSNAFDICHCKAKCLLIDSFQNDRGLTSEEIITLWYRRILRIKMDDGFFPFLDNPCGCQECLE